MDWKSTRMETVSLDDAAANFAQLAERAGRGEEIVISKDGVPLARLVAPTAPAIDPTKPREFGFLAGQVWMSDDFDAPLEDEFMRAFEGD